MMMEVGDWGAGDERGIDLVMVSDVASVWQALNAALEHFSADAQKRQQKAAVAKNWKSAMYSS